MSKVPFGVATQHSKSSLMHSGLFGVCGWLTKPSLCLWVTGKCSCPILMHKVYITLIRFRHKTYLIRFRKGLVTLGLHDLKNMLWYVIKLSETDMDGFTLRVHWTLVLLYQTPKGTPCASDEMTGCRFLMSLWKWGWKATPQSTGLLFLLSQTSLEKHTRTTQQHYFIDLGHTI